MTTCHRLTCNNRLSYFGSKTDAGVLSELEALESGNK
jgi:hypothetical protein